MVIYLCIFFSFTPYPAFLQRRAPVDDNYRASLLVFETLRVETEEMKIIPTGYQTYIRRDYSPTMRCAAAPQLPQK